MSFAYICMQVQADARRAVSCMRLENLQRLHGLHSLHARHARHAQAVGGQAVGEQVVGEQEVGGQEVGGQEAPHAHAEEPEGAAGGGAVRCSIKCFPQSYSKQNCVLCAAV